MARALLIGWISRFGCLQTITTDQGHQFESHLFHSLEKLCGIQLSRTTAQHPAGNRPMERFHRTLKAAITCPTDQHWAEALPLVFLGIRTAFKDDVQASVAELVYGEPLRIPGELLTLTTNPVDPADLNTELCQHMATRHAYTATFVHSDLEKCKHIFLWQNTTRRALEPPYSGPYQVLSWREKTMQILERRRPLIVSTDRVKPAYMLKETGSGTTTTFNLAADSTLTAAPHAVPPLPVAATTCSEHHVHHFPACFNT
jgi:cleavage and polyadenylation specificity factor subunit 1